MCVRVFFFFLFFVEVCDVGTKRLAVNCGEKTAEEGREKEAALEARKEKKKKTARSIFLSSAWKPSVQENPPLLLLKSG